MISICRDVAGCDRWMMNLQVSETTTFCEVWIIVGCWYWWWWRQQVLDDNTTCDWRALTDVTECSDRREVPPGIYGTLRTQQHGDNTSDIAWYCTDRWTNWVTAPVIQNLSNSLPPPRYCQNSAFDFATHFANKVDEARASPCYAIVLLLSWLFSVVRMMLLRRSSWWRMMRSSNQSWDRQASTLLLIQHPTWDMATGYKRAAKYMYNHQEPASVLIQYSL